MDGRTAGWWLPGRRNTTPTLDQRGGSHDIGGRVFATTNEKVKTLSWHERFSLVGDSVADYNDLRYHAIA